MLHYVVIHKITKKEILIADLGKGLVKYTPEEFFKIWTGVLILLVPTVNFQKGNENIDTTETLPIKTDKGPIKTDKRPIKTDKREELILNFIRENGSISNKEACEITGLKDATIKRTFRKMVENGIIVPAGERKSRRYVMN